jgi:putative ABC transport system substrate-binding protein
MLEALHELMPKAARIAALVNPTNQNAAADTKEAEAAARTLGLELQVLNASNAIEIDDAFALLVEQRAAALLIEGDPFFIGRMKQLVVLTARHAIPAIYQGLKIRQPVPRFARRTAITCSAATTPVR